MEGKRRRASARGVLLAATALLAVAAGGVVAAAAPAPHAGAETAVEPGGVNVTLVGIREDAGAETGRFADRRDPVRQSVPRDGESVLVAEVTTRTDGGVLVNGTAVVEVGDAATGTVGTFLGVEGGRFRDATGDRARLVTGADGTALLLFRPDAAPESLSTRMTATLADGTATDASDMRLVGVRTFESGALSGRVTDAGGAPLSGTVVYVRTVAYGPDAGDATGVQHAERLRLRPRDNDGDGVRGDAGDVDDASDAFVVVHQRYDDGAGAYRTVSRETATADDLQLYGFEAFPRLDLADGLRIGVELYDRTGDSGGYVLDPVPVAASGSTIEIRAVVTDGAERDASASGRARLVPGRVDTADVVVGTPSAPTPLPGQSRRPTDTDGDGRYEDVTGDGSFDVLDVAAFLDAFDGVPAEATASFDFAADGTVDVLDVAALLEEV